jgi:competence protein ComEC
MQSVKKHLRLSALILLILVNIFIWSASSASNVSELEVYFFDVGQGDAILIKSPSGKKMLIDSGPDRSVLAELSKVLAFNDRKIDVILATHPDADHIGGFPAVLDRYEVDYVIESGVSADTRIFESFQRSIENENAEELIAKRRMTIDLGGGTTLLILFPDRDVSNMDRNDASIIAKLSYGEIDFLLTGDAPAKIEDHLVSINESVLQSEVLKVGHHGSKTSTSEIFVNAVSPEYAIISAGQNNKYGHPHSVVLETLNNSHIHTFGTYKDGTVLIKSDGQDIYFK